MEKKRNEARVDPGWETTVFSTSEICEAMFNFAYDGKKPTEGELDRLRCVYVQAESGKPQRWKLLFTDLPPVVTEQTSDA